MRHLTYAIHERLKRLTHVIPIKLNPNTLGWLHSTSPRGHIHLGGLINLHVKVKLFSNEPFLTDRWIIKEFECFIYYLANRSVYKNKLSRELQIQMSIHQIKPIKRDLGLYKFDGRLKELKISAF